MSGPLSTSPAASQPGLLDPLDSLIDFTDYENATFQSPSLSPAGANKGVFTTRPIKAENTTPSLLSTSQPLSGPSHQYDLYKQQTGIVPGALATTLAVNQNNAHIHGYTDFGGIDYLGMTNTEDLFDFNTSPSQASMTAPDMDMDFDSPSSEPSFFFDATVNPTSLGGQEPSGLPSPPPLSAQTSNVGRLWPGMHQQAARAQAQAQAQAQQRQRAQAKQTQKPKSPQATDPIVEQKITQLLNSMRSKPGSADGSQSAPSVNLPRLKKDEEDMDDDEKLLASEEGKKLTSKERRQLRNKVSARAFRSRRKEYISQLESEIANKVSENGDLRAQNRALVDENKRLSDLTRMLLQSPSFSDFLDRLSSNPQMLPQAPAAQPQPQAEQRQVPKDPNPYAAQQQVQQHQQIGLAMIPEQTMDFSMLNMDPIDGFSYQPQVYSAVLETHETTLDASVLSGKTTTLLPETFDAEEEKVEMPIIQRPQPVEAKKEVEAPQPVDKEFESNPAFALYHDEPASEETKAPVELDTDGLSDVDIFGGIEPEKVLARYELVNSTEEERVAGVAMARIQRISATLESVRTRLEALTVGIELEDEA